MPVYVVMNEGLVQYVAFCVESAGCQYGRTRLGMDAEFKV